VKRIACKVIDKTQYLKETAVGKHDLKCHTTKTDWISNHNQTMTLYHI